MSNNIGHNPLDSGANSDSSLPKWLSLIVIYTHFAEKSRYSLKKIIFFIITSFYNFLYRCNILNINYLQKIQKNLLFLPGKIIIQVLNL